jgi:hypothetical protein
MLIRPHSLALITTHQCTAACDHCCFSCTPKITKRIPYERLISLIDEASQLKSIRTIAFTGGECFLLGDELDSLIAHTTGCGLSTCCITNGYWAASRPAAEQRIVRLAQAGLKEIRFSTGPFHSQYVPAERVVHGACASANAGLKTRVKIEHSNESHFDIDSIVQNPVLKRFISRRQIKIDCGVWIENGGAARLSHRSDHSRFTRSDKRGCPSVLNQLAVTPDEILVACCGLHLERIPELHFGSLRNSSLGKLIQEAPDDLLKIWIRVEGPGRIGAFVRRHAPSYELPLAAVHACEACLHLCRDAMAKQIIRDHREEVERRIRLRYLAGMAVAEFGRVVGGLGAGFASRVGSVFRGKDGHARNRRSVFGTL